MERGRRGWGPEGRVLRGLTEVDVFVPESR